MNVPHADDLRSVLLSHRVGVLVADESPRRVRFVVDLATGAPIVPLSDYELGTVSLALMIPDEGEDALQLLVDVEVLDANRHDGPDRWRAYHGRPDQRAWALLRIESARRGGIVIDGREIMRSGPLVGHETALCRLFNASPERMARFGHLGRDVTAVGVDELGVDVRTVTGIVRLAFGVRVRDADEAGLFIERLLRGGGVA